LVGEYLLGGLLLPPVTVVAKALVITATDGICVKFGVGVLGAVEVEAPAPGVESL
jgi:hypothetical protein